MRDIGGKVAVITGASGGIGSRVAEALFDHGMRVVVSARSAEVLEALAKGMDRGGQRSQVVVADITSEDDRLKLLSAARERFGAIDVLVNNAGVDHPEEFVNADFDRLRQMVDLNLVAYMRLTQMVLPEMLERGSGHVVNVASTAGLAPVAFGVVYAATKHGVVGFSESLRAELHDTGVGVSVVCPNFVSEAGLFHDNSGGDTARTQTVTPQQAAEGVVKAITGDRARVIVSPPLVKLAPLVRAISPDVVSQVARREGSFATMKRMADRLREQEGNGASASPTSGASAGPIRPRTSKPAKPA